MKCLLLALISALVSCCICGQASSLRGCIGTYDNTPRLPSGRMDIPKLISELVDSYATAHSRLGGSTVDYVQEVVKRGLRCCDGVLIYRHQDPVANAAKYQVVRTEFHDWTNATTNKTKK